MTEVLKKSRQTFTLGEIGLWFCSVILILTSFFVFDRQNYLILTASLIGVTSLIYNARGNPFGQLLMVVFSMIYGLISFRQAYYGEMITYVGMTAPMAVLSMVEWMKHPYEKGSSEVRVSLMNLQQIWAMVILTALVTFVSYFILRAFHTSCLFWSTVSVATSFLAVYLTWKRSPYYALGYAANDVVLIILWSIASISDPSCISVVICFAVFLINDLYGYYSWSKMRKRQEKSAELNSVPELL